jgi:hypothetical protein
MMNLTVLHDKDGRIIAAAHVHEGYEGPIPAASADTEVATFVVPEEHRGLPMEELCVRLKVNRASQELMEADQAAD